MRGHTPHLLSCSSAYTSPLIRIVFLPLPTLVSPILYLLSYLRASLDRPPFVYGICCHCVAWSCQYCFLGGAPNSKLSRPTQLGRNRPSAPFARPPVA